MFKEFELYRIAEWCNERGILPCRVDHACIKSAARSLQIPFSHKLRGYEVKRVESLMEEMSDD